MLVGGSGNGSLKAFCSQLQSRIGDAWQYCLPFALLMQMSLAMVQLPV